MRKELARLVHPVLQQGLALKRRLEEGETPPLSTEQAVLKGLLLTETHASSCPEFGPDPGALTAARPSEGGSRERFLGIRYALACWLDEILISDTAWGTRWNERKLEVALYATNDRAWRFWQQAQQAEARSGVDALEAFFLCVMLGFRGERRESPGQLNDWVAAVEARIVAGQTQAWSPPLELAPPRRVPPLWGPDHVRRVLLAEALILVLATAVLTFLVVQQFQEIP